MNASRDCCCGSADKVIRVTQYRAEEDARGENTETEGQDSTLMAHYPKG
jgi:hypothetical protein